MGKCVVILYNLLVYVAGGKLLMMIIVKNYRNCLLYRNLIEWGQRNKLMQRNKYLYLDVQEEVRHYDLCPVVFMRENSHLS